MINDPFGYRNIDALLKAQESPTTRAMRAFEDTAAQQIARNFAQSSTLQIAEGMDNSASARLVRELYESPAIKAMQGIDNLAQTLRKQFEISDLARVNQWVQHLNENRFAKLETVVPGWAGLPEVDRIRDATYRIASGLGSESRLDLSSSLGLNKSLADRFLFTELKIAALASSRDVLGFTAVPSALAYTEIFGSWRTTTELPRKFWQDRNTRVHHYKEAEVDDGLIEATPSEAIQIVIEGGLSAGASTEGKFIALLDVAGIPMQITSTDPSRNAYQVVNVFERQLQDFVNRKLREKFGEGWFKQRVDGGKIKNAKEARLAALKNGEKSLPLYRYLHIGDIKSIILRRDNWEQIFSNIFPNGQQLDYDLQGLIAARNPTMHVRPIDGVRLVELMCVVSRLSGWIVGDGDWKRAAEHDD